MRIFSILIPLVPILLKERTHRVAWWAPGFSPLQEIILSLGALTQIQYLIQLVCHWDLFTCEKHPDFCMFKISFATEASVKTSQLVVKLINSQEYEYLILPQVCENCWIQVWWDDYQRGMPKLISIFLVEVIMYRGKSNPQKYKPGSRTSSPLGNHRF